MKSPNPNLVFSVGPQKRRIFFQVFSPVHPAYSAWELGDKSADASPGLADHARGGSLRIGDSIGV